MRLIKLTSPELIEEFFGGEESVEVNESCKIVTETEKVISEGGALVMLVKGEISIKPIGVVLSEEPAEIVSEKKSKKKK